MNDIVSSKEQILCNGYQASFWQSLNVLVFESVYLFMFFIMLFIVTLTILVHEMQDFSRWCFNCLFLPPFDEFDGSSISVQTEGCSEVGAYESSDNIVRIQWHLSSYCLQVLSNLLVKRKENCTSKGCKEERELYVQRMSERLRDEAAKKKPELPVEPKNPLGRPRKQNSPMITTPVATSTPVVEQFLKRSRGSRGSYINWFTNDRWPQIAAAVKNYRNISTALHYLKVAYRYCLVTLSFQAFYLNTYA